MKALNPAVINLLDKLIIVREVYDTAGKLLEDNYNKGLLVAGAEKKAIYAHDLAQKMGSVTYEKMRSLRKKRVSKVRATIASILSDLDDEEIVLFCLQREEELLSMYHSVITATASDYFREIVQNQLDESEIFISKLTHLINSA